MNSVPGSATSGMPIVLEWPDVPSIGLNFYDGRFLRAADLNLEHQSLRGYSDVSTSTGGYGVVRGLDFSVSGGSFAVGAGLAVDGRGRLLNLPEQKSGTLADLLATATPGADPSGTPTSTSAFTACAGVTGAATPVEPVTVSGTALFVVTISRQQVPYGQADVLGRLCDDACVGPTDSPYVVDGIALSVSPMESFPLPGPGDGDPVAYLRSRVASGWFARERSAETSGGSLLSQGGLRSGTWGRGATSRQPLGVPLAVLGWDGTSVTLLDTWTVRRERMETPAAPYWSGRVERRPWPVFLAQVLQFQTQLVDSGMAGAPLADRLGPVSDTGSSTAVANESWQAVDRIATMLAEMGDAGVEDQVAAVRRGLGALLDLGGSTAGSSTTPRSLPDVLVDAPPAGYLPVTSTTGVGLRRELESWFGGAVDLRVCAVGRDQIPGELDSAQHLDRISLLPQGDPSRRDPVDVLVPDGRVQTDPVGDLGLALSLSLGTSAATRDGARRDATTDPALLLLEGVARVGTDGGVTLRAAAAGTAPSTLKPALEKVRDLVEGRRGLAETAERFSTNDFGTERPSVAQLREDGARMERSMVVGRAQGGAAAQPPATASRSLGASASLWLARDPFTLPVDERTAFHAEWETSLGSGSEAVSMVADGWARRGATTSGASSPETSFLLVGAVQVTLGIGSDARTERRNLSHTVWLGRVSISARESVLARDDDNSWHARVDWGGHPMQATASVTATKGTTEVDIGDVTAGEDPNIERTGDAHRDAALAALQIVSALHPADSRFVERGFADLFPVGRTGLDSMVVPVTDWVLFRRRTWRTCESGTATPVVGTSTVAAWVVRADGKEQADAWTDAVRTSPNPDVPWPKAPILVQFETGTSLLRSGANAWRAELEGVPVGALVTLAGYARTTTSTEGAVGIGRAQAVVDAGDPVFELATGGIVDLVADPPARLLLPDTQGSLLVITYDIPEPVEVIALTDLDDTQKQSVRDGDVTATAALPANQTEAVADLADVADVSAAFVTTVSDYVRGHGDGADEWVVWVRDDLPDPRGSRVKAGADQVRSKLSVPDSVSNVGVRPDGGGSLPAVRVYVLLTTPGV